LNTRLLVFCIAFAVLCGLVGPWVGGPIGLALVYISGLWSGGVLLILLNVHREHKFREAERLDDERIRTAEHELEHFQKLRVVIGVSKKRQS